MNDEKGPGGLLARLERDLRSKKVEERVRAVMDVYDVPPGPETRELARFLVQRLPAEHSSFVRATMVKAVAAAAPGEFVDELLAVLGDADDRVRSNTFEALSGCELDARILSHVVAHLDDPSIRVRGMAMVLLERADVSAVAEAVRDMLDSGDPASIRSALVFIERQGLGDGAVAQVLGTGFLVQVSNRLREAGSSGVRYHASMVLHMLASAGVEEAVSILERGSESGTPPGWEGEDGPPPEFVVDAPGEGPSSRRRERLAHREAEKRLAEVKAVAEAGEREALPLLKERCLVEEDPLVQKGLVEAMGRLGGESARSELLRFLAAGPVQVRRAAIDALVSLGDDESARAVAPYTEHEDIELKAAAAAALAAAGRLDGMAFLTSLADGGTREDQLCALMAIRFSPLPRPFHEVLVRLHSEAVDDGIRDYAQETERILLRRGLLSRARISHV